MADEFIHNSAYAASSAGAPEDPETPNGNGIEQLLGQRTSILKTKLDVFASELFERIRIRSHNVQEIGEDQERLGQMIEKVARQADYNLRDRRDTIPLHDRQFQLQQERRDQEVSCWRDLVDVMRDFLLVWEALEQARARSMFLSYA